MLKLDSEWGKFLYTTLYLIGNERKSVDVKETASQIASQQRDNESQMIKVTTTTGKLLLMNIDKITQFKPIWESDLKFN